MLEVKDLKLSYGSNNKTLTFKLSPGSVTWLKGRNGAGKSTLMLTLMGFQNASSGGIFWQGDETAFAYAPQKPDFRFGLSVARVLELAQVNSASDTALTLGMSEILDRPVTELSGGEAQRLSLAVAFNKNAELLLLDEPFASQDVESISKIKELIAKKRTAGCAVLIASHIEIPSDQIIELN